jgi:hypothetical protein
LPECDLSRSPLALGVRVRWMLAGLVALGGCGWLWGAEATVKQDGAARAEVWGLELGATTAEQAAAWAQERGLGCTTTPSQRRATMRMRCTDGLSPALLPDRTVNGQISELLLAWPDDGRVHFVSVWRRYSIPDAALADYTSAVASVQARLGAPTRAMPVSDPAALNAKLFRFGTRWEQDGFKVDLELARLGADYVSVSEVWSVPGVEEQVGARQTWGSTGATKAKGAEAE